LSSFCRNKETFLCGLHDKENCYRDLFGDASFVGDLLHCTIAFRYLYSLFNHFATLARRLLPQMHVAIGALCTELSEKKRGWQFSRVKTVLSAIRCSKLTANVLSTINPLLNVEVLLCNKNLIGHYHHLILHLSTYFI